MTANPQIRLNPRMVVQIKNKSWTHPDYILIQVGRNIKKNLKMQYMGGLNQPRIDSDIQATLSVVFEKLQTFLNAIEKAESQRHIGVIKQYVRLTIKFLLNSSFISEKEKKVIPLSADLNNIHVKIPDSF